MSSIRDRHIELIRNSGLFDESWYETEYQDVKSSPLSPIEHYARYGAILRRNPSKKFDSDFYSRSNPDVAIAGFDPLIHYILHGQAEGREPLPFTTATAGIAERVDLVIPVFNALADVQFCLNSIIGRTDGFSVRAIVVNDGSGEETAVWLREFCAAHEMFTLIDQVSNRGYTKSVNAGLRASDADYVVTLNSDTIVTDGWLKSLVRCINSDPSAGIVGPLSNAATWQNVPDLYDSTGSFAVNELPSGITPDTMALLVARSSKRRYPQVPFVNGFCFMIKRNLIDRIGIMDEEGFPVGYGEENDYCIRAQDAGFKLLVADDAYVFHAKSKSFGHSRRKELSKEGTNTLKRKHGDLKFKRLVDLVKRTEIFDEIRADIANELATWLSSDVVGNDTPPKILFVLPVKGGSGGAHSVVQEVCEMRRMGYEVQIAVRAQDLVTLSKTYQDIEQVDELFVGFSSTAELIVRSARFDVAVATVFHSMQLIKDIFDVHPHILPAYYIQDYEPLFFSSESDYYKTAIDSYTLLPHAVCFAKTQWIINKVKHEHGVHVHKVPASIDHSVYHPKARNQGSSVSIVAMIRPQTPRRGADRTMRVLSRIYARFGSNVSITIFGCDSEDPRFVSLDRDFIFSHLGVLNRPQVANLLSQCDVFLDFSDYQAFGRTALEAMACGSTAIVPIHGGADDYARDKVNCLVVDSLNEEHCYSALAQLVSNKPEIRRMQLESLISASNYSVHQAAIAELVLFQRQAARHQSFFPKKLKRALHVAAGHRVDGLHSDAAHIRLLGPLWNAHVLKDWDVFLIDSAESVKSVKSGEILICQDDMIETIDANDLEAIRADGGIVVFDITRQFWGSKIVGDEFRRKLSLTSLLLCDSKKVLDAIGKEHPDARIIPDCIDPELWKVGKKRPSSPGVFKRREGDPVRIGYIGATEDAESLLIVKRAVERLAQDFGEGVEIEVIGVYQTRPAVVGKRVGLPRKNDYPHMADWLYRRVHWDIAIIPVLAGASDEQQIRYSAMLYAALGQAVISSNVPEAKVLTNTFQGIEFCENTDEGWYDALSTLVIDGVRRQAMSEELQHSFLAGALSRRNLESLLSMFEALPSCMASSPAQGVIAESHSSIRLGISV